MDYQKLIIVGRVGKTPELRYTTNGTPVTNFSVAVGQRRGDEERTTWFRVACWEKLGETTNQYLVQGQEVLVEGTVNASAWADKDGTPQATLELTASRVVFGRKPATKENEGTEAEGSGEDIPF